MNRVTLYRVLLVLLIAVGSWCAGVEGAIAHPLGNFTINHFARLSPTSRAVAVQYVVDMAEIPAFQALQTADLDGDRTTSEAELQTYLQQVAPKYVQGLTLQIDQQTVPLQIKNQAVSLPPGVGGLPTLRLEWDLLGDVPTLYSQPTHTLKFSNDNDPTRIGWREIVVQPVAGVRVFDSSAYADSRTDALRNYPQDLLATPLQETVASFSFTQGDLPPTATPLLTRLGSPRVAHPQTLAEFWQAIAFSPSYLRLTPTDLPWNAEGNGWLAIAAAVVWGAMHSLTPGHGKTVVGAYLVGTRATPQHALFLALTTTITHTLGVFALGLITLFAAQFILPEQLYPWLSLLSGLMVAVIGFNLFQQRFSGNGVRNSHHHHPDSDHSDHHHHHHDHHSHDHLPAALTWRSLLALGISGGLMPCPAALVILLSAIALGKVALGLTLVLAFSLGLAGVLTALGLLLVYAKHWFKQMPVSLGLINRLPAFSAVGITLLGLGISTQAIFSIGSGL